LADGRVDINQVNKNGDSPLILASFRGYTQIVKILIAGQRVDINIVNEAGNSPLILA